MVWLNEPNSGGTWSLLVAVFFFLDWIDLSLAGYYFYILSVEFSLEVRRLEGSN